MLTDRTLQDQPTGKAMTMNQYMMAACCVALWAVGCGALTDTRAQQTMQRESDRIAANKELARRWFDEVINQRNLDALNDTYAAGYVHHGPQGAEMRGLESARAFAAAILAASEDRHAVVEQQVAEGDWVVTRFTSRGRHTGRFRGIEPSGKTWTTEGICISRIENGLIVEDWEIVHQSGL